MRPEKPIGENLTVRMVLCGDGFIFTGVQHLTAEVVFLAARRMSAMSVTVQ